MVNMIEQKRVFEIQCQDEVYDDEYDDWSLRYMNIGFNHKTRDEIVEFLRKLSDEYLYIYQVVEHSKEHKDLSELEIILMDKPTITSADEWLGNELAADSIDTI